MYLSSQNLKCPKLVNLTLFLDFYRNPKPEITNAAIGLPEKHPLLAKALEKIESYYDPHCWICIGPQLLTDLAIEMGNVSNIEEIKPKKEPKEAEIGHR